MPRAFLVLICIVVLVTVFFGLVIWKQTIRFEKKAAVFKQRKEEYLKELEEEAARRAEEEASLSGPEQEEKSLPESETEEPGSNID
ncbi:MAG TPA: hypothetical protein VN426_16055 [Syntrophomonadaceae bacterium]|nr:hypothetical protein [Syntrophomonadaceae bacterium]